MSSNEKTIHAAIVKDGGILRELSQTETLEQRSKIIQRFGREMNMPVSPEAVTEFLDNPIRKLSDQNLERVVGGKEIRGDCWSWLNIDNDYLCGTDANDEMHGGKGPTPCTAMRARASYTAQ